MYEASCSVWISVPRVDSARQYEDDDVSAVRAEAAIDAQFPLWAGVSGGVLLWVPGQGPRVCQTAVLPELHARRGWGARQVRLHGLEQALPLHRGRLPHLPPPVAGETSKTIWLKFVIINPKFEEKSIYWLTTLSSNDNYYSFLRNNLIDLNNIVAVYSLTYGEGNLCQI